MKNREHGICEVFATEEQINKAVSNVAGQISKDYADKNLLLVCILNGAVVFLTDLMRKLDIPVKVEFMRASSYKNSFKPVQDVSTDLDLRAESLDEYDVLVVEDIADTGSTLSHITEHLKSKNARSVRTCTFLDKPFRRKVSFTPDYVCFVIEKDPAGKDKERFAVGYGLDYEENYRALPYVGFLDPDLYLS